MGFSVHARTKRPDAPNPPESDRFAYLLKLAANSPERWETQMGHYKYFVGLHEGQWQVSVEGVRHGPYPSQRHAYLDAADAAKSAGDQGHQAQVFIQGRDNKFHAVWTYGKDPYPPRD